MSTELQHTIHQIFPTPSAHAAVHQLCDSQDWQCSQVSRGIVTLKLLQTLCPCLHLGELS